MKFSCYQENSLKEKSHCKRASLKILRIRGTGLPKKIHWTIVWDRKSTLGCVNGKYCHEFYLVIKKVKTAILNCYKWYYSTSFGTITYFFPHEKSCAVVLRARIVWLSKDLRQKICSIAHILSICWGPSCNTFLTCWAHGQFFNDFRWSEKCDI